MFKADDAQAMKTSATMAEKNYVIQKNDLLELEVYTSKGERLIDPDSYLQEDRPDSKNEGVTETPSYLVDEKGIVKFPMVGEIKITDLTLRQAEDILQTEYAKYYKDVFVVLKCTSKRVVVLGAPGGQVIPLTYENMRLTEVLALAKGVSNDAKATNIRVLRGNEVYITDLSTFEGYQKNNLIMESGDVIYVEPIRRPFTEALRDYGPLISVITSLTTLIVVVSTL
ncbi:MAG TPA: polysaccharide biosynthesis/export family protein [Ohtaekwangia sp.]